MTLSRRTDCYVYQQQKMLTDQFTGLPYAAEASVFTGLFLPMPVQTSGQSASLTPQCLVYRAESTLSNMLRNFAGSTPDLMLISEDKKTRHLFWCVKDSSQRQAIQCQLDQLSAFYRLQNWVSHAEERAEDRAEEHAETGEVAHLSAAHNASAVMPVLLLADDQIKPLPCHRLFADLAGMDDYEFLQRLQKCFNVRVATGPADATPRSTREFGLYVAGCWYHLNLIEGTWFHADPVSDLDVSVVHDNMIAPMLGITDREDKRIAYTGADFSLPALQQLIDSGQWQALWLMPPPSIADMMRISDLGRVMPAYSVCFPQLIDAAVLAAALSADAST